jgi:hypothetical protein
MALAPRAPDSFQKRVANRDAGVENFHVRRAAERFAD